MALLNKRSTTAGAIPNLVSGELAHNITDDILFLRYEGYRTALRLAQLRNRSTPDSGQTGAPLTLVGDGVTFAPELAPYSLVGGSIDVDAPTGNAAWAIPGEHITGAGASTSIDAGVARVERFHIASDQIRIQELAIRLAAAVTGTLRVGLVQTNGSLRWEQALTNPAAGLHAFVPGQTLSKGFHSVVLWCNAAVSLKAVSTAAQDRAFDILSGSLVFSTDVEEAAADFSAGIDMSLVQPGALTRSDPLTEKTAVMKWTQA